MILLDTNALIALASGWVMRSAAQEAIASGISSGTLAVTATTAWEIGLLATRTGKTSVMFQGNGRRWFTTIVAKAQLRVVAFDADTAFEAAYLPAGCPNDPADRWIIAATRLANATLVTSDRAILAYAGQGYLNAVRR